MKRVQILLLFILLIVVSACSNVLMTSDTQEDIVQTEETEQEETKAVPEPEPEPKVYIAKITAIGDLMVHDKQLFDAYNSQTNTYDFNFAFEQVAPLLSRADYTIGNLETTLAGEGTRGYTGYPEFNTPDSFAQALKNAGFDFLTTANNHSYDRRYDGLVQTLNVLDELGLDHTGTYTSIEAQNEVFMTEINNISFAIVSFTYGTNGIPVPKDKDYSINLLTEEVVKRELQEAKSLNPDVIIALPHMGNEYELIPNEQFVKWADLMFAEGADIVLASHPHVLQPVEYKFVTGANGEQRKVFVAYSLGNFISSQRTEPREAGAMLHFDFTKVEGEKTELTNVSYTPTWVQYRDRAGNYHIRVLPVYDVLQDVDTASEKYDLVPADIERIKRVHQEIGKTFLKRNLPLTELQEEYVIEQESENINRLQPVSFILTTHRMVKRSSVNYTIQ